MELIRSLHLMGYVLSRGTLTFGITESEVMFVCAVLVNKSNESSSWFNFISMYINYHIVQDTNPLTNRYIQSRLLWYLQIHNRGVASR
jgi:hypothetical protein